MAKIELGEDGQDWRVWAAAVEDGGSPKNDSDVTSGFWRLESKGYATPVRTFFDATMIHVQFGTDKPLDGEAGEPWHRFETATWPKVVAVYAEDHAEAIATGFWPDGLATSKRDSIGANEAPPDAIEAMLLAAQAEIYKAEAIVKAGAAKTKTKSDAAANLQSELIKLKTELDETREKEKKPHFEAAKAVDERFQPFIKRLNLLANARSGEIRSKVIAPFLAQQEETRRAAAAAAQAVIDEQNRLAREAEEAERAKEAPEGETPAPLTDEEWREAAPEVAVVATKVSAGAKGAKVSLRDVRYGDITDAAAMATKLVELKNGDVLTLLQTIAHRIARHEMQAEFKHGEEIFPGVNMKIVRE